MLSLLFVSQKYDTRVISSVMELLFTMSATLTPVSSSKLVTGTTRKEVPKKQQSVSRNIMLCFYI